ncbi:GNAT family N-acetyltransferase [Roseimaritima ulvae]|uniref:Acetyltransferase (GNAT) family protein n=1 Tax=Roseimaritima ulvae TaxID=980254 RepID=A0A5B9QTM2_9BACT|nr:GNAT family N-acetyltransferase [Roseimaritima ulvae]QEG41262.1 Acetyltransferase (GNAT) family protein [Roseimaritima ulvae]
MNTQATRSIRWLAYRVVRRFAIADVCHFYQSPIDAIPRTPTPDSYTIRSCSSNRLRKHASELDYTIPEQDLEMLDAGAAKCIAAFQADSLAGFAWVAFGTISGDMNHDGKPETGLPIQLSDEAAFVFQVLVLPQHRGRRLYAAFLSQMVDELQSEGIRYLVLTTEASNRNALRAVERMQFRKVGQASLFRIGPFRRATYPTLPNDIEFTVGRYVGDDTAARSS